MLGAAQLMDTGCPEDAPAGAHAEEEEEAQPPGEHGGAPDVRGLQQQVAGLRQELQTQQARWMAILQDLRTQMDALKEPSPGPPAPDAKREPDPGAAAPAGGRRTPRPGGEDAARRRAAPSRSAPLLGRPLSPRSAPTSQPVNIKVERIDAGKMVSCEEGGKTVSIRLLIRKAPPAGPGARPQGKPAPKAVVKALPAEPASAPHPTQPVATQTEEEDGTAAQQPASQADGRRGSGCGNPEDEALRTTILRFPNGDVKKTLPDHRVVHYCASTGTTRTTHPSGLVVVHFPDKRTEKFHPDGSKEIFFPDGTVTCLHNGQEETVFPDGTLVCVARNGDRIIVFSNGQREIHTAEFKRREYPDGSVRTVYRDGRQEIRDAFGRVTVRGEAGARVLDLK